MKMIRKACAVTATLALFGAVASAQAQSDTWAAYRDQSWPEHHMDGADYTSSTYFTIHTPEQLAQFAWYVEQGNDFEGKTVTLANDYYADEFDMAPHLWVAAGSAANPFCGVFEGNGKTVRGIKIHSASDAEYDGLFACVMAGAVIRNLRMADVDILTEPSPSATTYYPSVGALAGFMNGRVENCFVVNGTIHAVGKGDEPDSGFLLELKPGDPEPQGYDPIPSAAHIDRWFDATGILCLAGNSTSKKAPVNGKYFVTFADGFWAENTRVKIAFTSNNGKNGSYAIITEEGMQFFDASGTPRNDVVVVPASINMSGVKGVIKNIKPKYTTHNWLAESFNGFWFTNPNGKGAMQAHLIWVDDGKGPRVTDPEENPVFLSWDNPSVNVGGLVGDFCLGGVTFLNCANGADVSVSASDEIFIRLGGIAGRTDMAFAAENVPVFRNCLNTGTLSVVDSDEILAAYVGGITGEIVEESECYVFQNCFNSGVIGALPDSILHSYAGGMVGTAKDYSGLTFESCYFWSARIPAPPHGFVVGNRAAISVDGTIDITFPGRPMLLPHEVWDTGDADKSGLHYWARTQPEGLYLYGGLYRGWTYDGTGVVNDGYPVLVDTFTGTKVTFHAQDGDTLKCQTVYASFPDAAVHTYMLPLNTPTRAGYDFDGWAFKATDGGGVVDANTSFFNGSPTEVEAKWAARPVMTVFFDYNGATGGNADPSKPVTFNEAYGALPDPTRGDFRFLSWFLGAKQVSSETIVTNTTDHTIGALWLDLADELDTESTEIGTIYPPEDTPGMTNGAPVEIVIDDGTPEGKRVRGHLRGTGPGGEGPFIIEIDDDDSLPPGGGTITNIITNPGAEDETDIETNIPITVSECHAEVFLTEFIWVGETNIGYCVWHKDSPGCTNGAPVCVYFDDEDGKPSHYGYLALNAAGNFDIILDDPIDVGLVGPHIGMISLVLNPSDADGSKYKEWFYNLSDTVLFGSGDDLGEIVITDETVETGTDDVVVGTFTPPESWDGDPDDLEVTVIIAGKKYRARLVNNGNGSYDVVLDEQLDDGLSGETVDISITVTDLATKKELATKDGKLKIAGDGDQWIYIREIIAPPLTGNADVFLAWDTAQIKWYTPQFRARGGAVKYIVYTSPTLMVVVNDWAQYDTSVDRAETEMNLAYRTLLDHQVKMINSAKETTRFYKVKAVKVLN